MVTRSAPRVTGKRLAQWEIRSRNPAPPNRHPRSDARPNRSHGREHHAAQSTWPPTHCPQNGIGSDSLCDQQLPTLSPGQDRTIRRRYFGQGGATDGRSATSFTARAWLCRIVCRQRKCSLWEDRLTAYATESAGDDRQPDGPTEHSGARLPQGQCGRWVAKLRGSFSR